MTTPYKPTQTPEEARKWLIDNGFQALLDTPPEVAPTLPPSASQPPPIPIPPLGAPAAAQQPTAAGIPLPAEPPSKFQQFLQGVGQGLGLSAPSGVQAGFELAQIPARIGGEGLIGVLDPRGAIPVQGQPGVTQRDLRLQPQVQQFQQQQGRMPNPLEMQPLMEAATPLPWGVRGAAQMVADPLNAVPGIGFTNVPRRAAMAAATALPPELMLRSAVGALPPELTLRGVAQALPPELMLRSAAGALPPELMVRSAAQAAPPPLIAPIAETIVPPPSVIPEAQVVPEMPPVIAENATTAAAPPPMGIDLDPANSGRWFTDSSEVAGDIGRLHHGGISYIDVPSDVAGSAKVPGRKDEWLLPADIATQRKALLNVDVTEVQYGDVASLVEAELPSVAPGYLRLFRGEGLLPESSIPPSGITAPTDLGVGVPAMPPGGVPPVAGVGASGPAGRGFQLEPFDAPVNRLLVDTPTEEIIRKIPVMRQAYGFIDPAAVHQVEPVARLGMAREIYKETQKSRAKIAAMDWMAGAQDVLGFDSKGRARNVQMLPGAPQGPLTRTVFDLVEHPERYALTPQQEGTIHQAQGLMDSVLKSEQAAGVNVGEVGNYWARDITGGPDPGNLIQRILGRSPGIGGGLAHTKSRAFPFADDLVAAGYKLNTDPLSGLTKRLEAGVDAIADKEATTRIGGLPGVEGGRSAGIGEREIFGNVAPIELVKQVDKWISLPARAGPQTGDEGMGAEALRLVRSTLVSLDLSAGFIQGQTLFFRNNAAWWKAQAKAIVSVADQPLNYVSKNYDTLDEGIRMGAITPPSEYLASPSGLSSLPSRIPVAGQAFTRLNRAFEWFTFVGQHELYKAAKGNRVAEEELVSLGSAVRKIMGTESAALSGMSRKQQTVEAYLAFAPRFYRGVHGMLTQAATPGAGGDEARKSLGALLAGATAVTIGVNYASEKRLPNFTNPEREDWGKAKVGGSYVSFYGPLHGFLRTQARAGLYTSQGDPNRALNELGRYAKNKASVPVRGLITVAELATKGYSTTFDGDRIETIGDTAIPTLGGLGTWAKEQLPISPVAAVEGVAEGKPEQTLNMLGLPVQSPSPLNALAQEVYPNQPDVFYEDLPPYAQGRVRIGLGDQARDSDYARRTEKHDQEFNKRVGELMKNPKLPLALSGGSLTKRPPNWSKEQWDAMYDARRDIVGAYYDADREHDLRVREDKEIFLGGELKTSAEETDPLKKALAEYHEARGLAVINGVYEPERFDRMIELYESPNNWTDDQKMYVRANTNMTPPPGVLLPMLSEKYRERLRLSEAARRHYDSQMQQGPVGVAP